MVYAMDNINVWTFLKILTHTVNEQSERTVMTKDVFCHCLWTDRGICSIIKMLSLDRICVRKGTIFLNE